MSWLFWPFMLLLIAAIGVAGLWAYRTYVLGDTSGFNISGLLFRPKPLPRLGVIEQATVDSRRRLVLVRRDDVEHLIMTGGPVDVVIETGITAHHIEAEQVEEQIEPSPPVFTRQPRSFGQAVNE